MAGTIVRFQREGRAIDLLNLSVLPVDVVGAHEVPAARKAGRFAVKEILAGCDGDLEAIQNDRVDQSRQKRPVTSGFGRQSELQIAAGCFQIRVVVKGQESEPAVDFGPVGPFDRRVVDGLPN
jgi:hypothetical protein